jgi:cytoskeletal protein CcmA (bactofilin family)
MFKKSEESEWTRFSRALGGTQPASGQRDEPADDVEEPVTMSQPAPRESAPVAPMVDDEPDQGPGTMAAEVLQTAPYEPPAPEPAPARPAAPMPPISASVGRVPSLDGDETVIGANANIEGKVRSDQSIRVSGTVQGEIESKQRVIVDEGARVQARIAAAHVTVLGEVNGAIECSGRVEIAASGRVSGEVTAGTLVIQEGAYFEGHLKTSSGQEVVAAE